MKQSCFNNKNNYGHAMDVTISSHAMPNNLANA